MQSQLWTCQLLLRYLHPSNWMVNNFWKLFPKPYRVASSVSQVFHYIDAQIWVIYYLLSQLFHCLCFLKVHLINDYLSKWCDLLFFLSQFAHHPINSCPELEVVLPHQILISSFRSIFPCLIMSKWTVAWSQCPDAVVLLLICAIQRHQWSAIGGNCLVT